MTNVIQYISALSPSIEDWSSLSFLGAFLVSFFAFCLGRPGGADSGAFEPAASLLAFFITSKAFVVGWLLVSLTAASVATSTASTTAAVPTASGVSECGKSVKNSSCWLVAPLAAGSTKSPSVGDSMISSAAADGAALVSSSTL